MTTSDGSIEDYAADLRRRLLAAVDGLGKPSWRPMLAYLAELHVRALHPPHPPVPGVWEEIGPGYHLSPAFGHWDLVHQIFDSLVAAPEHARLQLRNNWALQQEDGLLAGSVFWRADADGRRWDTRGRPAGAAHIDARSAHPPMWPDAVDELLAGGRDDELLGEALAVLRRQLAWFERERSAPDGGFFYRDIVDRDWESGVDEGLRFDDAPAGRFACIDATCHLQACYAAAARWAATSGEEAPAEAATAADLAELIREQLWHADDGFFYDAWSVTADQRPGAFEGLWPLASRVATPAQATRLIDEHLLVDTRFGSAHPVPTVALDEPRFELRMWRGPAWNSMTWWLARGCLHYDRADAASTLLERALDRSADWYERTGTIWEFYHPHGCDPRDCHRKLGTVQDQPCADYLGHNPLIAMAGLWRHCTAG